MTLIEDTGVECPYCGEPFETVVDCSAGDQSYVEDCPVCCRPIEFQLHVDNQGGLGEMRLKRDDE